MLLFISVLVYMQKKHVSFSKRVFTALGIGLIFGLILQFSYGASSKIIQESVSWFDIAGVGYVKLLQMVVMPLVFISILASFTRLKFSESVGKIGGLIIVFLIGTTAVAAAIGIGSSLLFHLQGINIHQGSAETAQIQQVQGKLGDVKNTTLPQKILELLPGNPFMELTGARPTSTIAVVIFSAILGIAFLGVKRKEPEHAELFSKIVDALYAIVMRVVTLILRLTPFGVLALITKVGATSDLSAIWKLGKFVIASYVALIVMFLIHLLLISISGLSPVKYVKKVIPVLTFAFTSRSSAGSLPLNIKAQTTELGVPEGIANFAGSFGVIMGQNGCAGIYPAMLAIMVAPAAGINPLSPSFILMLIVVVAISSFGVAGVGGGATFAALIVLSTMNLPIAIVGLLISVEPLIDMGRTALNVSGSMVSGILTSKVTKELDTKIYDSEAKQEISA
ncbi:L-cystine transporter [Scopulibacillus daqui]|nr:L-cystine transporter [Scopulibacillus daqui]